MDETLIFILSSWSFRPYLLLFTYDLFFLVIFFIFFLVAITFFKNTLNNTLSFDNFLSMTMCSTIIKWVIDGNTFLFILHWGVDSFFAILV